MAIGGVLEKIWSTDCPRLPAIFDHRSLLFAQSWKYFRNASSTFIELQFKHANLMSVQAIVGMVCLN